MRQDPPAGHGLLWGPGGPDLGKELGDHRVRFGLGGIRILGPPFQDIPAGGGRTPGLGLGGIEVGKDEFRHFDQPVPDLFQFLPDDILVLEQIIGALDVVDAVVRMQADALHLVDERLPLLRGGYQPGQHFLALPGQVLDLLEAVLDHFHLGDNPFRSALLLMGDLDQLIRNSRIIMLPAGFVVGHGGPRGWRESEPIG